jgi:predicted regulator of Ras-like GTPase activity (Roadblock/LC7/MglB family)
MTPPSPENGPEQLNRLLSQFVQDGGFSICVLTDRNGLPIASACDREMDPERQAAIVGLIEKNGVVVAEGLGFERASEISFSYDRGRRLICKFFQAGGHDLILALTVEERQKTYRRSLKRLAASIRDVWELYWN